MKNIFCKLGIHDWEDIGFQGSWWHKINITDRICLKCGRKDLRLTKYYQNIDSRYEHMKNITKQSTR